MKLLKSTFITLFILGLLTGCGDNSTGVDSDDEEEKQEEEYKGIIEDFEGPTYSDDYTPIASWTDRSQWNLANVHDPTVVKDGDYYYMYQTNASYGNAHQGHGNYPYRRSKDLVNWEYLGAAFQSVQPWVKDSLNSIRAEMDPPLSPIEDPNYGFWAPHITKVNDIYRLYYSVVITNPIIGSDNTEYWTERAFIGLAESTDLSANSWEDKGMVIHSVADGEESYHRDGGSDWSAYFKYNAIDPSYVVTPEGEHWLVYGSWHSGIAAVQIDPATGKPSELDNLEDYGIRIAGRGDVNSNRWQGLEAPEIIYNEETGYYYLFLAYDELSVAYNTRVARSRNITGPYHGIDGGNVTEGAEAWPIVTHPYKFSGHYGWVGISHCSIFQDPETGKWFYSSQGRLPRDVGGINASNAIMMGQVREIYWTESGWPVVVPERYAAVPDIEINEEDIVGTWEEVTLNYQYQTIQTPYTVKFNEDHTLGGRLSGTWSYDKDSQTLTVNDTELIIDTAWNWEASPRRTTITYAGLTTSGRSVWGKRVE
ncbi:arabinan endo-1,5-alpha-L-arabinosidase [Aliifodinibius sp. S!AR15-10]|uniref:arabinan endo-1,5-alpha-L-arabinosidase n=1 Tax=Aliifodinibius sp. S!AR15-10 TaxID=2950437 RepID=UPI0028562E6D|nr:arabinan endo-1,5-alpha-L-arabinosidase [Aliifodinibius sp. S!AR15-10]MDR8392945.1 arabinan endo-1,5-alpha-L-arabinosidase [Aliifodinibius sp. S!AR15-10]